MRKHLPALTSLRFFAAAMIVIHHTAFYFKIWEPQFVLTQGVTFFFVLSGFILTYTHSNLNGTSESLRFIWDRIARVWPAHIFVLLMVIVLYWPTFNPGHTTTTAQLLANASLMQAWSPYSSTFFSFNAVSWTLSVEMFFYMLFPLLIINFAKTWHWKLALSISFIFIALGLIKVTGAKPTSSADEISYAAWLYIWPPARLMEFVLGMIAGLAYLRFGHYLDKTKTIATLSGILAVALILFGAMKMPIYGYALESWGVLSEAGRGWFSNSGVAPLFALGIFLIAGEKGVIQGILSWRPLILLGEISFSVYLTHQVIFGYMAMHPQWMEGMTNWVQMGIYWALTLVISYFVWRFVEKPSQRVMRSLTKRKPASVAVANPI